MALVSTPRDGSEAGAGLAASGLRGLAPFVLAAVCGVCALAAIDLATNPTRIVDMLGDTDDAVRLMEVRALIGGASWGDMTLAGIGAPAPLVSHWSRLIDLPLALLIMLLTPLLGAGAAETVTRFVWPLLLLVPLCVVLARAAAVADAGIGATADPQRSASAAGFAAVALTVTAITGLYQFLPGRIDHHNAMILATLAGLLLLNRSISEPALGTAAGIALGLALAVGYEPMALVVAGLVVHALAVLVTRRGETGLLRAAIAMTAAMLAALLLTTAPSGLASSRCDALSLNLVLLAAAGTAGLWLAIDGPLARRQLPLRLAGVAAAGAAGLAAYGLAGPTCLAGPFGGLDPSIDRLLLRDVIETRSWFWQLSTAPGLAVTFAISAGLGLVAAFQLWRADAGPRAGLMLVTLGAAIALGLWQTKLIPYASFLAVVPLAAWIGRLPARGTTSSTKVRVAAALAASQIVILLTTSPLLATLKPADQDFAGWLATAKTCITSRAVAPLAALPPGLALTDRDLGPYVAASTSHRVVAGPYHRLDKALLATDGIFFGPEQEAEGRLRALGVDYIAVCPGFTRRAGVPVGRDGLLGALVHGRAPAWLEAAPLAGDTPIRVWRLRAGAGRG